MANTPTTSPIRVQTRQEQLTLRAVAQKIPIPTQPEPDSTDSTGHSDNEDGSEASSGSRAENDAEPSDNPPQTSVADKVNDQMRKYASGIPKELSGAKKYFVVWNGMETGIFGSWDKCQPLVKRYPGAGYKSAKNYNDAVRHHSARR
ncbi:uncharacterized protein BDZ83DRAFT_439218 [Colletotrichum acutatum]|uniref:Ribonuclease H1 N-terminal domain-containing protein n=1 Tax=Glomerella acutata TaxID=27357 RepID=A0AAD8UDP8_GLOAC|nr:uncharacterized protein BDZ83DRAFT_439218 [Colletotrichum acutatum]KAK1721260.1 hypothetical protein BDZ83DRAFT_439218 [Colletotrichum acutatum]